MPRPKKDGVNINYYIKKDIKLKLDAYCYTTGLTQTAALERLLNEQLSIKLSDENLDEYLKAIDKQ